MIDFHTHAPLRHAAAGWLEGAGFTAEDFLEYLDEAGISLGVVLTHDGLFHPSPRANDEVAEFVGQFPDRLVGLGTVNPRLADAADETRRCLVELGLRGLKLHPWLQGFCVHEPFMDPICEVLAEHGGLLLMHDGTPPYSTGLQIAVLARRHPRVPVILGHGGLHDCWREALVAAQTTSNVYLCCCGTPPYAVRRFAAEAPVDRLLFGSDAGLSAYTRQPYAVGRAREVMSLDLAPQVLKAMMYDNPRRLLGLS